MINLRVFDVQFCCQALSLCLLEALRSGPDASAHGGSPLDRVGFHTTRPCDEMVRADRLTLRPVLRALAILCRWAIQGDDLGHFEAPFSLVDFTQRDGRCAEIGGAGEPPPCV